MAQAILFPQCGAGTSPFGKMRWWQQYSNIGWIQPFYYYTFIIMKVTVYVIGKGAQEVELAAQSTVAQLQAKLKASGDLPQGVFKKYVGDDVLTLQSTDILVDGDELSFNAGTVTRNAAGEEIITTKKVAGAEGDTTNMVRVKVVKQQVLLDTVIPKKMPIGDVVAQFADQGVMLINGEEFGFGLKLTEDTTVEIRVADKAPCTGTCTPACEDEADEEVETEDFDESY